MTRKRRPRRARRRRTTLAELSIQERLQPSLLDRLTDDEPDRQKESRDARVLSLRQLRAGVLRDLAWLFNCVNLEATDDLEAFPEVANSVLNYGLPDLSGKTISGVNEEAVERTILEAIWKFEPRLLKGSIDIRLRKNAEHFNHNAMVFEIEGQLWAQPMPIRLFLQSEVDLETGSVTVGEVGGRSSA